MEKSHWNCIKYDGEKCLNFLQMREGEEVSSTNMQIRDIKEILFFACLSCRQYNTGMWGMNIYELVLDIHLNLHLFYLMKTFMSIRQK